MCLFFVVAPVLLQDGANKKGRRSTMKAFIGLVLAATVLLGTPILVTIIT